MKNRLFFTFLVMLVNVPFTLRAQSELTLEDIFVNGTYRLKGFGPARWMEGGKYYTTIENSKEVRGRDIVRYQTKSGKREVLVHASDLIPKGASQPLSISDYIWSSDGQKLMIFTNTRKVWRYHTRGDYWVLDLATKKLRQLGKTVPATTMMFAKFSPDNKKVGFVSRQNIYVAEIKCGSRRNKRAGYRRRTICSNDINVVHRIK